MAGPATIHLCPNTTYLGTFRIDRDVTLIGAGASSSILHGVDSGPVVTVGENVTVTLQALGVTGGMTGAGGGIVVPLGGSLTLRDVEVTDNEAVNGGGIFVDSAILNLAGACRVEQGRGVRRWHFQPVQHHHPHRHRRGGGQRGYSRRAG